MKLILLALFALVSAPAFAGKKHDSSKGMFEKAVKKVNKEFRKQITDIVNKSESVKQYLKENELTLHKLEDTHRLSSFGEGGTFWATELAVFIVHHKEAYRSGTMAVMIKTESNDEDNGAGPVMVKAEVAVVNAQPPAKFETVLGKE